ncbi:DUF4169 family protein [Mesorhizobium sp. CAU 1741]|uniref:DUF4169 family protein n=1 Tax=Mesorhizobium sp. CAU 1741 TaxID=3140366 RepID=UPI00325BCE22
MAEIVNLRLARKRLARTEKERIAQENRARHGRAKAHRSLEEARQAKDTAHLDAHRREKPDGNGER